MKYALTIQPLFLIANFFVVESIGEVVHFDFDKKVLFLVLAYVLHQLQLNAFNKGTLIYDFNLRRSWLYLDLE